MSRDDIEFEVPPPLVTLHETINDPDTCVGDVHTVVPKVGEHCLCGKYVLRSHRKSGWMTLKAVRLLPTPQGREG